MYRMFLLVVVMVDFAPGVAGYVTAPPLYNLPSTTQAFGSMEGTQEMGQIPEVTPPNPETTPGYDASPLDVTPATKGPVDGDPLGLGIVGYEAVPFEGTFGEAGYRISVPGMPSFAIALPTSTGYQVIETVQTASTTTPAPPVETTTTPIYPGSDLTGVPDGLGALVSGGEVSGVNTLPSQGFPGMGFSGVAGPSDAVVSNGLVGAPEPPFGGVQNAYSSSRPDSPSSSGVAPNPPMSMLSGNNGPSSGSYIVSKPDPPSRVVGVPPNPPSFMSPPNAGPGSATSGGPSLWDQINTSVMDMKNMLPLAVMADMIDPIGPDSPSMEGFTSGGMQMNPTGQMTSTGLMNPTGQMGFNNPTFNAAAMTGQMLPSFAMQKMMGGMQFPMKTAGQSIPQLPQLPQGPSPYQNLFSGLIGTEAPATVAPFHQSRNVNPQMPNFNQAKNLMGAMMRSAMVTANLPTAGPMLQTSRPQPPSFGMPVMSSSSNVQTPYSRIMAQAAAKGNFPLPVSSLMEDFSPKFPSQSSKSDTPSQNGYSAYAISNPTRSPLPSPTRRPAFSVPSSVNFLYSQSRQVEAPQKQSAPFNVIPKRPGYSVVPRVKPTNPINFPSTRNNPKSVLTAMRSSMMAGRAKSMAQSLARNAAALASRSRLQNAQKKMSASRRPYPSSWKAPAAQPRRPPSPRLRNSKNLGNALKLKRLAMQNALKKLPYRAQARKRPRAFPKKPLPSKRPVSRGLGPMELMLLSSTMGEMELAL